MFRVLLVEDEGRVCVELAALLGALPGVEIAVCANSENAAIDELMTDGRRWDLVVVDLALGAGSGLRVLSAGRVRRAHQRMVVLNDRPTREMERRCVHFGADAVFDRRSGIEALLEYCGAASKAAGRSATTASRAVRSSTKPWIPALFSLFAGRPGSQEIAVEQAPKPVSRESPGGRRIAISARGRLHRGAQALDCMQERHPTQPAVDRGVVSTSCAIPLKPPPRGTRCWPENSSNRSPPVCCVPEIGFPPCVRPVPCGA